MQVKEKQPYQSYQDDDETADNENYEETKDYQPFNFQRSDSIGISTHIGQYKVHDLGLHSQLRMMDDDETRIKPKSKHDQF